MFEFAMYINGHDYRVRDLLDRRFSVDKDGISLFVMRSYEDCVQRIKDIDYNNFLIHGNRHKRYLNDRLKDAIRRL